MAIYLIRHGETPGNRDRIVQVPETPLSDRGQGQARRLAERLSDHPIRRILASDLARAHMTAEAVGRALGLGVEPDPLLQERNFGDLRGTPYAELGLDLFGPGFAPPGGETWEVFDARVDRAWQGIRRAARGLDGHLAVVTHGLVLQSLARRHLGLGEDAPGEGLARQIGNTSLTVVESAGAAPAWEDGSTWRVALFACTAHLGPGSDGQEGVAGI